MHLLIKNKQIRLTYDFTFYAQVHWVAMSAVPSLRELYILHLVVAGATGQEGVWARLPPYHRLLSSLPLGGPGPRRSPWPLHCLHVAGVSHWQMEYVQFPLEKVSELFILPGVDDDISAGVEHQQHVREDAHVGRPEIRYLSALYLKILIFVCLVRVVQPVWRSYGMAQLWYGAPFKIGSLIEVLEV